MKITQTSTTQTLNRITSIIAIVLSGVVIFSLTQIDQTVHVQLYAYGLQFNLLWAEPYWTMIRLAYPCLITTIVLSAASLIMGIIPESKHQLSVGSRELLARAFFPLDSDIPEPIVVASEDEPIVVA